MTTRSPIDTYARSVVDGEVPAGKYHQAACRRFLSDRERDDFAFDEVAAERAIGFFPRLRHYKGQWAGTPIQLEPWQQFIVGQLFGWRESSGLRRYRSAYIEVPRKNGKTLMAAVVAIYATFFDAEPGAEGYCAATSRDQAHLVFRDAEMLVLRTPALSQRIERAGKYLLRRGAAQLRTLSSKDDSLDGLSPHLVIVDEYHAHPDRKVYDVLETALGAREQPLFLTITTAGSDPHTPCGELHDHACRVLDTAVSDDRMFAFIAHADAGDDPHEEETWRKANPNLGVSVLLDDMRERSDRARSMPSAQAAFKQKRLNIWVKAVSPWLDIEAWQVGQSTWDAAELDGRRCWGGLDLAAKIDLAAFVLLFLPEPDDADRRWRLLSWFFTPKQDIEKREKRWIVPLERWADEGLLEVTPGARIDHGAIRDAVVEADQRFRIERVGFDPWNIGNFDHELQEVLGWDEDRVIEVRQTYAGLSWASKELEAEVASRHVDAGGNEVMTWMAANAIVDQDSSGNIRPTKNPKKLRGRIDGIVATVIAREVARFDEADDADSPYTAERGIQTVTT